VTTFCRLDELGLVVVGQHLQPDRAVLACRVADDARPAASGHNYTLIREEPRKPQQTASLGRENFLYVFKPAPQPGRGDRRGRTGKRPPRLCQPSAQSEESCRLRSAAGRTTGPPANTPGKDSGMEAVRRSSPLAASILAAVAGVNPAYGAPIPPPVQSSSSAAGAIVGHERDRGFRVDPDHDRQGLARIAGMVASRRPNASSGKMAGRASHDDSQAVLAQVSRAQCRIFQEFLTLR
jgi:hypothetical protein